VNPKPDDCSPERNEQARDLDVLQLIRDPHRNKPMSTEHLAFVSS
jgi:hypothetical protein